LNVRRTLVVNADDLGLTVGVNTGIFDAHDRGILTSASLMAHAPATANAIRGVRSRPTLGVGVHLTLVDGGPIFPPDRVPTLVNDDGQFRASWKPFIVACLLGRVSMQDVERELTAQVECVAFQGITVTHLDAHKHVHVYPPVFEIVVRLAARFGIPVIRVPYERTLADLPLYVWAQQNYRLAAAHGIATPAFAGRAMTGVMTLDALASTVQRLRPGRTELMVHPGYVDAALRQIPTRLLASRETEVALLTSSEIDRVIAAEEIRLASHDLQSDFVSWRSFRHAS
jgi:chitin disaccharide deacetylase